MKRIILFACLATFISCTTERTTDPSIEEIRSGFNQVPDTIHTSAFWYWITDHLSKEGVVHDLQSMKEAGINRAFIGFIGLPPEEMPVTGNVKTFSDEWWDILRTAFRTATELDIEIGVFNCPGWSQSGGPWIKPEQAMRYLASEQIEVQGGKAIQLTLDKPDSLWQDVKVLAYPKQQFSQINTSNASFIATGTTSSEVSKLFDGNRASALAFSNEPSIQIDIETGEPFTLRGIEMIPTESYNDAAINLQYRDPSGEFISLATFNMNRINPDLAVGFLPYAPMSVAVDPVTSSAYRIVIENITPGSGFSEIILTSRPIMDHHAEKTFAKMHQSMFFSFHDYLWDEAVAYPDNTLFIDPEKVVDITNQVKDGVLSWDVPEGEWVISRYGMLPTGVVNHPAMPWDTGYEVDKMNKDYINYHFDQFIGEILDRIPREERETWRIVVADSFEKGGQNFTDNFLSLFQEQYGYDPIPFLPVYEGKIVGNTSISDRFLWDMRRLIADKLAYNYVGGLRKKANENGLKLWLENYGTWGFPGEFLQYGGQTDEISGEFWSEGVFGDIGNIEVRAASSAAHIYGKNKVSAESFTSAGAAFSRYPATIKQRGDRFFTEGVNNTLLHLYIHQGTEDGKPGLNAPFGTEFDRKNSWFSHLDLFTAYIKRINFMLQQGINVADVAYFIGEDTPKMIGETEPELPDGYQFDYINAEVLLTRASVQDGFLTLPDKVQYKVLVLPQLKTMRPEVLSKIKELVNDGLVVLGPKPEKSPSLQNYPEADQEVKQVADELWGEIDGGQVKINDFGKGKIIDTMNLEEVFTLLDYPADFHSAAHPVLHGHRTLGGIDIYFLSNQSTDTLEFDASFRVTGNSKAERWDPVSGEIKNLFSSRAGQETTTIPLKFYPNESYFVVFQETGTPAKTNDQNQAVENFPAPDQSIEITTPWELTFNDDPVKRGPSETIIMKSLSDLSRSADDRIKYYSGKINYATNFTIPISLLDEKNEVWLNLGQVVSMAKIKVNGEDAGGIWTYPYSTRVTPFLKEGTNSLEIEVVNTWVNRIIGDLQPGEKEQKVVPINNPWSGDSPLMKSGILGRVKMEVYKESTRENENS